MLLIVETLRHIGFPATLAIVLATGIVGTGLAAWTLRRNARLLVESLSGKEEFQVDRIAEVLILMVGLFLCLMYQTHRRTLRVKHNLDTPKSKD